MTDSYSHIGFMHVEPPASISNRNTIYNRELMSGVEYRNCTSVTVYITHRDGITYRLPPALPSSKEDTPGLHILSFTEFKVIGDGAVSADCSGVLETNDVLLSNDQKILKASFSNKPDNCSSNKRLTILRVISADELRKNGGDIYIRALDICISTKADVSQRKLHPNSFQADLLKTVDVLPNDMRHGGSGIAFKMTVRYIEEHGPVYFRLGDKIYKITPQIDVSCSPGLYVYDKGLVGDDVSNQLDGTSVYYTFAEMYEKFPWLHKTYESASSYVDELTRKQNELAEAKLDHESKKMEHDTVKMQFDREAAERKSKWDEEAAIRKREWEEQDRKRAEAEAEIAAKRAQEMKDDEDRRKKLDREQEELANARKEYYERKSYERKEAGEALKTVGVVVAGILAVVAIFKK